MDVNYNEGKVIFPELGITKGDVLRFYERLAVRLIRICESPDDPGAPAGWSAKERPTFLAKEYSDLLPLVDSANND